MLKKTALVFSVLLHPLLMPVFGFAIILFSENYVALLPLSTKKIILILITAGTIILPLLMSPLVFLKKETDKNERLIPLTLTLIFYLLTYYLFNKIPVYHFLHNFMGGACLSLLMALIINIFWKISLHMLGLGGITALLIISTLNLQINVFPWLVMAILSSGIAGTSRLVLDAHSPAQIYSGYLLGFTCIFLYMI